VRRDHKQNINRKGFEKVRMQEGGPGKASALKEITRRKQTNKQTNACGQTALAME